MGISFLLIFIYTVKLKNKNNFSEAQGLATEIVLKNSCKVENVSSHEDQKG